MTSGEQVWLVVNGTSGSFSDKAVAGLVDALHHAGRPPARIVDCQSEAIPDRAMLEGADVKLLVAYAGDGTLNTVLGACEGWSGQVLVLPGGTTNLLASALHGSHEAEAIVAALGRGQLRVTRRPCLRSRQGTAYCEVLAGPGASWSEVREGMREGDVAAVASKAVEAVQQSVSGPMVILAEPALGKAEGYAGLLATVGPHAIAVDGYGAESLGDYLRHGLSLLRRDFREGPHDDLGTHREFVCRSADGSPLALMIDGERRAGAGEERFSLAPLALDLLALQP